NNYDHVVIDGPPVLGFADAPLLAGAVNGVLFVLESRGTRRGQARGALKRIQVGRSHLLGAVLTKFNSKTTSYGGYDYAYDYHYGAEEGQAKPRKGRRTCMTRRLRSADRAVAAAAAMSPRTF